MTTATVCAGSDREHTTAWTGPRPLDDGRITTAVWAECSVCDAHLPLTTTRLPVHEPQQEGGDHP